MSEQRPVLREHHHLPHENSQLHLALRIPQMFNHSDGSSEGLGLTLKQVLKKRKKVNN